VVKIWQLIGGPLAAGASHGTTGTMDNSALSDPLEKNFAGAHEVWLIIVGGSRVCKKYCLMTAAACGV